MKKKAIIIYFFSLLFSFSNKCPGRSLNEVICRKSLNDFNIDSIKARTSYGAIKINPIQGLFSEIPVSFELICPKERSVQFQVGYIFPLSKVLNTRNYFEMGTNGDATSNGLFSYRQSPFNNYGFSIKLEFRKYGRYFYHGPQLMYKNCFYKESIFPVYGGNITLNQTESKFSSILGFGYILGRQYEDKNLVVDWYGGIGLRLRSMSVKILKIENPAYQKGTTYPNREESFNSVYPFINLGVRIGFKLWKKVLV